MLSRSFLAGVFSISIVIFPLPGAEAASFDVPGTHPTIQAAVAAAAVSADLDNTITLSISPINTGAVISIGVAFGPARHLTIRPAAPLERASVVSTNPGVAILELGGAGNVVIQDLDIIRNITNNYHLVVLSTCENVTIERCRIGSNWTTPGGAGWSNIELLYPTEVVLRNNVFFAYYRGTFDKGVHAWSFNDPANSLRLYNNVVADYKIYGIHIEAAALAGPLIVLRNNVVVNNAALVPEPVAFRSNTAIGGPTVFTTHNTAFASAGFVESVPAGNQDIAGLPAAALLLRFNPPVVVPSFLASAWSVAPPWDFNPGYYHLVPGGPLHNDAGDYGMNVGNVAPDVAVMDDIDQDPRPGGPGPHTDRGVDQIETGTTSAVADGSAPAAVLRAAPRSNPGTSLLLDYRAERAGSLRLAVFDPSGRRLFQTEKSVEAGAGVFAPPIAARGLVFYRMSLRSEGYETVVLSGKAVVLR